MKKEEAWGKDIMNIVNETVGCPAVNEKLVDIKIKNYKDKLLNKKTHYAFIQYLIKKLELGDGELQIPEEPTIHDMYAEHYEDINNCMLRSIHLLNKDNLTYTIEFLNIPFFYHYDYKEEKNINVKVTIKLDFSKAIFDVDGVTKYDIRNTTFEYKINDIDTGYCFHLYKLGLKQRLSFSVRNIINSYILKNILWYDKNTYTIDISDEEIHHDKYCEYRSMVNLLIAVYYYYADYLFDL